MSEAEQTSLRVLEVAVSRGTITAEQLETLTSASGDVCDLAVERELITAAEIELLRPLAESTTYLPNYEILELIGDGGAGAVYRANQTKLNREVALKILKPSVSDGNTASQRSQLEAQVGGSLQHPNIVAVHDYGVHRQRVYLALELVEGESLLSVIERSGAIEPTAALEIARQVTAALDYASSKGVVHRDIKPANLMLTSATAGIAHATANKAVKVTDFGLAFRTGGEEATRLTAAGATLGTPSYVAPEQLEDTNVDHRADIYALGASLFHMVTGQQPFAGGNAFQAIAAKMRGSEEWREKMDESVPEPLRKLIADMTQHSADDRIPDYQTVAQRIDAILANQSSAVATPATDVSRRKPAAAPTSRPATEGSRSRRWLIAAGVVVLALFGWWFASHKTAQNLIQVQTERIGNPVPLFDRRGGIPVSGQVGLWIKDKVAGINILSGTNGRKMFKIDRSGEYPDFVAIRVLVSPIEDSIADICFSIKPNGDCTMVRLSAGMGQLGQGNIDTELFEPISGTETIQLRPKVDDEPADQVIFAERQPSGWFVRLNDRKLGAVPVTEDDHVEFFLKTIGTTHFNEIEVYKNKPVGIAP